MEQPTASEIYLAFEKHRAATSILHVIYTEKERASYFAELKDLRKKKTTWVGRSEQKLRMAIDEHIKACGG